MNVATRVPAVGAMATPFMGTIDCAEVVNNRFAVANFAGMKTRGDTRTSAPLILLPT